MQNALNSATQKIAEKLTHQGLKSIYVLLGEEPLSQREHLDAIRIAAKAHGYAERTSLIVERNFNWQQIQFFGQSSSLFANLRLLEITIPSGKPGIEGSKALQALAEKPLQDTIVIIMLPQIDWREQKSAWFNALERNSVMIETKEVSPAQLPQWIAQRLSQQQQHTDAETLEFIAHQVEGNLLAAHQEIQKLGLLYPTGELNGELVRAAILNVSRFDPSQLGEAVLSGDVSRTVRILQGLKDEGIAPIVVMNPLIWAIKPLVKIKQAEARGESLSTAFSNAKLFGEKQTLAKRAIARLSLKQLEAAHAKLAEIDKTAKGILQGDAWLEISRLCFGLARIKARTR
jgi:DNA polymerase-3 subunit delta